MTAKEMIASLKGDQFINIAINDCVSPKAGREVFTFVCSRAGSATTLYLESLSIGRHCVDGLTLDEISKFVTEHRHLEWLDVQ
jgi:hypothetical protein